jgi:glyoxylase-like metal-dependent hydrolase (beta-lactamase superfamily II)
MSEYTGAVQSGGPAGVRRLGRLTISKSSVGSMDNNAYLLEAAGEALLIDAAAEPDRLLSLVGELPLSPSAPLQSRSALRTIVTTHRHGDHWQALAAVAEATGAETVAHPLDAPSLPVTVTRTVSHGDTVTVGDVSLQVIHLRGHTPGSIALLYEDTEGHPHLFTGDSLFPGGVGRTSDPTDFASLLGDVQERIFDLLPDQTWVYPGHGNDTTLGAERPHLKEWRERGW